MDELNGSQQILVGRGYTFADTLGPDGSVIAMVGVRVHRGVVDIVQFFSEHDAVAVRVPGEETNILSPWKVLWRTNGPASDVVEAILTLPDPTERLEYATGPSRRCRMPAFPERAVWVAMSDKVSRNVRWCSYPIHRRRTPARQAPADGRRGDYRHPR